MKSAFRIVKYRKNPSKTLSGVACLNVLLGVSHGASLKNGLLKKMGPLVGLKEALGETP